MLFWKWLLRDENLRPDLLTGHGPTQLRGLEIPGSYCSFTANFLSAKPRKLPVCTLLAGGKHEIIQFSYQERRVTKSQYPVLKVG